eukprot:TRINITY_DN14899_c0_g1_i1.p1 TRINITY_DN14899_c0_g1~~TRINITY_DN14899_c0_g1_i1.p1  ORF type:complete len:776 (+),score=266.29 TRINITY_DN14899_c0_g1_i1:186-2513(+)
MVIAPFPSQSSPEGGSAARLLRRWDVSGGAEAQGGLTDGTPRPPGTSQPAPRPPRPAFRSGRLGASRVRPARDRQTPAACSGRSSSGTEGAGSRPDSQISASRLTPLLPALQDDPDGVLAEDWAQAAAEELAEHIALGTEAKDQYYGNLAGGEVEAILRRHALLMRALLLDFGAVKKTFLDVEIVRGEVFGRIEVVERLGERMTLLEEQTNLRLSSLVGRAERTEAALIEGMSGFSEVASDIVRLSRAGSPEPDEAQQIPQQNVPKQEAPQEALPASPRQAAAEATQAASVAAAAPADPQKQLATTAPAEVTESHQGLKERYEELAQKLAEHSEVAEAKHQVLASTLAMHSDLLQGRHKELQTTLNDFDKSFDRKLQSQREAVEAKLGEMEKLLRKDELLSAANLQSQLSDMEAAKTSSQLLREEFQQRLARIEGDFLASQQEPKAASHPEAAAGREAAQLLQRRLEDLEGKHEALQRLCSAAEQPSAAPEAEGMEQVLHRLANLEGKQDDLQRLCSEQVSMAQAAAEAAPVPLVTPPAAADSAALAASADSAALAASVDALSSKVEAFGLRLAACEDASKPSRPPSAKPRCGSAQRSRAASVSASVDLPTPPGQLDSSLSQTLAAVLDGFVEAAKREAAPSGLEPAPVDPYEAVRLAEAAGAAAAVAAERAEKALIDYSMQDPAPEGLHEALAPLCSCSLAMRWSDFREGPYAVGWKCCNFIECGGDRLSKGDFRWFCKDCQFDYCDDCIPRPAKSGKAVDDDLLTMEGIPELP